MSNQFHLNGQIYRVVEKLGEGSYGQVYKVVSDTTLLSDLAVNDESKDSLLKSLSDLAIQPEYFVIKKIEITSQYLVGYIKNEIQTMKWLTRQLGQQSPFCQLIDYRMELVLNQAGRKQANFYLLMEYLTGTDLNQFIKLNRLKMSDVLPIFRQLLLAVNILHAHQIIHRDLKLENLFVHPDGDQLRLIVLDFGFTCNRNPDYLFEQIENSDIMTISQTCQQTTNLGTVNYMPPEFYLKAKLTFDDLKKADVWACGIILFALIYRKLPFRPFNQLSYPRQIHDVASQVKSRPTLFNPIFNEILVSLKDRKTVWQIINNNLSTLELDEKSLSISPLARESKTFLPIVSSSHIQHPRVAEDRLSLPRMSSSIHQTKMSRQTEDRLILPPLKRK